MQVFSVLDIFLLVPGSSSFLAISLRIFFGLPTALANAARRFAILLMGR